MQELSTEIDGGGNQAAGQEARTTGRLETGTIGEQHDGNLFVRDV